LATIDLFDLADENSRLSTILADVKSQTQLGLRLQNPPDQGLSNGIQGPARLLERSSLYIDTTESKGTSLVIWPALILV
jgi:hypothetical protein